MKAREDGIVKNKRLSLAEIESRKNKIRVKAQEIGITAERLQTYIDTLFKTKDAQAAFERATDRLEIKPEDQSFVREVFGGNPMKLFSK